MRTDRKSLDNTLRDVLDQSPFAVYVNALDDWNLLYINAPARGFMKACSATEGTKCFETMGFDKPCPFCRVNRMSREKSFSREFYHPLLKRTLCLTGKLIDWCGTPAHIEYIADITDQKQAEEVKNADLDELKSVLKNVPGGLCVYRFDGKQIEPIFHNEEFYRIMGYSDGHIFETLEKTENLNVHPEDEAELNRKIFEAIKKGGSMSHVYRVFNDRAGAYRYIRLEGIVKRQPDGVCMLYGLYTDVDDQRKLEQKLVNESIQTQNIINSIPGGVAIYRVSDVFESVFFSDGVPELIGYTVPEYSEKYGRDAMETICVEDRAPLKSKVWEAMEANEPLECEFRKQHRDGHFVWVHLHARKIGDEDGNPLLQCVFHNITELKNAQQGLDHLVNSIPGGIAVYRLENGRFRTDYCTDGVAQLTGHSREEYDRLTEFDSFETIVFSKDRERVKLAIYDAMKEGSAIDLTYRRIHRDGHPVWVHLNAKLMGMESANPVLYAVFTGMSAETKLYQNIANETADGIYVVDRNNYDLLYANESVPLFMGQEENPVGKKCYYALHGKSKPCAFCSFHSHPADNSLHEMRISGNPRIFHTRFRETDWNGIPAYIKFVSDVTEEDNVRRQKERLEEYFQTLIKILPGGVAVVRYEEETDTTVPEFISEGFAAMCGMTVQEVWDMYRTDSYAGMHPDDAETVAACVMQHLKEKTDSEFELIYRLRRHDESYFWVKNSSTLIHNAEGGFLPKIYSTYSDINNEMIERERMHGLYNDMLLQHHRSKDPNLIIAGHCSLTERKIKQITDRTGNDLLKTFGDDRDGFFTGFASLIVDEQERKTFLNTYLTEPMLRDFRLGKIRHETDCFVLLPNEETGRFVHIIVNTVTSPDTKDVMGILSVIDCTERKIAEQILHRLANTNYDFIADVDLRSDSYKLISHDRNAAAVPCVKGSYSKQALFLLESLVVPKDRALCEQKLDPNYIREQLAENESYSFHYTIADPDGNMLTKNMVVFYIDKRLERLCLARTDITDSVREQRQLLNILAYTFDLACFIDVAERSFMMHTRETVLSNLSPYTFENYDETCVNFTEAYGNAEEKSDVQKLFRLDYMMERLGEHPKGYEFTYPYISEGKTLYKQINVLWGDESHRTICMVRADVTEALTAERLTKEHLKSALAIAQEANRAKTDFLSSMSHDIRTPMNAIIGMTDLAISDRGNPAQIDESLGVIKNSSEHLLHLINDILDMSRIESGRMVLLKEPFNIAEEMNKVAARATVLAERKNVNFHASIDVKHGDCIGDAQRIQQILDNLIGNAVKFTPEGGDVNVVVRELPQKNETIGYYRFEVRDTGIGMSGEAQKNIFDPFYRVRSSEVKNIEGTGLGLSIVKSIVDYKGGTIIVESEPGKGSTFIVDIPMHFAETNKFKDPIQPVSQAEKEENLGGVRILLVEDHPINQLVATRILEKMGAKIVVTENGEEGWKKFEASGVGEFDAILMDVQMPVMDGYESSRAIRACSHPRAKTIPIVAMTANAFSGDVQRCLDAGMNAHVAKPIETEKLYRVLNEWIGRSK